MERSCGSPEGVLRTGADARSSLDAPGALFELTDALRAALAVSAA
jgi:hypothetical protein